MRRTIFLLSAKRKSFASVIDLHICSLLGGNRWTMRINMQKVFPVVSGIHFFIPLLQRKADILLPFGLKVRYDVVS